MAPSPLSEPPYLLIVAGPNGSGKSTAYRTADVEAFAKSVWIINPDLLTARIREIESLDLDAANLAAVERIEVWLKASIAAHQSVGVETVLSTDKYRKLVKQAKTKRFEIRLIYVILKSPELSIARVAQRVSEGGHDVPRAKIIQRYGKSLRQLPWFLDQADRAWIYDNSGAKPKLIAEKTNGVVTLDPDALPVIVEAAEKIRTT